MPTTRQAVPCPPDVLDALRAEFPDALRATPIVVHGLTRVLVEREHLVPTLAWLKAHEACPFAMLSDLTAVDYAELSEPPHAERFATIYNLLSLSDSARLILSCPIPEDDATVPTASGVYPGANWLEREVYDLFGIRFAGHPDLTRILCPDYFDEQQQHPLRKEYPLRGHGDRSHFPVYDPDEELDLSRFNYEK